MGTTLSALRRASPVQLAFMLLVVILVAAVAINPGFASANGIRAQLSIGAVIGTVAIGQTILILTGQIDLSIPWTMTAAGMTMSAMHGSGHGDLVSIAAALAVGLAVGLANTAGVALFRVQSLVWTLAMNTLVQGLVLVITSSEPPKSGVPATIRALAVGTVGGLPWAGLLWGVLALVTIVALRRTVLGRVVYATGISPIATFFCGIDVRRTYLFGFVLSGLCAALGGALLTGYTSEAYLGMGDDYLLLPIAAVVIGGTSILGGSGGYLGTIAGVLIMLALQSTLSLIQIAQGGREIILGLLILATLIAYGRRDALRA